MKTRGDRQRYRGRLPGQRTKIQLFKEKLSKPQPPLGPSPRDEHIALRSVKNPTAARVANRLPPPVVIRRKQIPLQRPSEARWQQDSSVADSSVSDEGARSGREEPSNTSNRLRDRSGHSRRDASTDYGEGSRFEFLLENNHGRDPRPEIGGGRPRKWGLLSKSASTNGTARLFAEVGGTITTSSSSYERDLQSLLSRPCENSISSASRRETGTSTAERFASRISGSTSSDLQEESELSSEERDVLIEGVRTPSSVCRNRIPKFGARRRIVATAGSSAKDYYLAGDRFLGQTEDPCCASAATTAATSKLLTRQHNVHLINDLETESDTFPGDLSSSSQKPTSAPTTLSLGRKLTTWTKEGKDLLVKSVSSANALAPTTMTCIKSPRTMSEHLLGQLEVPVTPAVLGALRVKGGSLREGDRGERVTDVPRQRWSSVRVKGGSTKSLLLENGGPQPPPIKGALRKEVFARERTLILIALNRAPAVGFESRFGSLFARDRVRASYVLTTIPIVECAVIDYRFAIRLDY